MTERRMSLIGFGLTIAVIVGAVALLNVGVVPADTAAAAECKGGGGDGESPSSTPSPSSSPTEEDDGLPITIPPPGEEDTSTSAQPTGSPSEPDRPEQQRCPTKVTIDSKRAGATRAATEFFGRLKSPENMCERGRRVLLKKDRKTGKDRTVGETLSKRSGKWTIRERRAKGRYYALAPKERRPRVICLKGRSKTIKV